MIIKYKIKALALVVSLAVSSCDPAFAGVSFDGLSGKPPGDNGRTVKGDWPEPDFDKLPTGQDVIYYVWWMQDNGLYDIMNTGTFERLKEKAKEFNINVPKQKKGSFVMTCSVPVKVR